MFVFLFEGPAYLSKFGPGYFHNLLNNCIVFIVMFKVQDTKMDMEFSTNAKQSQFLFPTDVTFVPLGHNQTYDLPKKHPQQVVFQI